MPIATTTIPASATPAVATRGRDHAVRVRATARPIRRLRLDARPPGARRSGQKSGSVREMSDHAAPSAYATGPSDLGIRSNHGAVMRVGWLERNQVRVIRWISMVLVRRNSGGGDGMGRGRGRGRGPL